MITTIEDLKEFKIKNKKIWEVECKCENCGNIFLMKKNAMKASLKKDHIYCRGCGISITKLNKPEEEKREEQKKREATNLARFGCKTKLTTPESRKALARIDWEARNKKIIETKTKNGTLKNHGLGLKDPETYRKTQESLIKNKGVSSYLSILGKERSLQTYDNIVKEMEPYSYFLNDRASFRRYKKGTMQQTLLYFKCKKCGYEYSGAFSGERKRCPLCYPEDWPSANSSRGENIIRGKLEEANIEYVAQKTFSDLKGDDEKRPLRFDFYLPDYNMCIEYQGAFHFLPTENTPKGLENLEKSKRYDKKKKEYCKKKGILLLEIFSYEEAKHLLEKDIFKK